MGLRAQILISLVVITLGAIASVGAIAIWQTRQVLSSERIDRAAELADLAGRLVGAVAGDQPLDDAAGRALLAQKLKDVGSAVGAEELAIFDVHGKPLVLGPPPPPLESDGRGVQAALAGLTPHAEDRPSADGLALVAYAPFGSPHPRGVVRSTFAVDRSLDAVLGRARTSVVILGALDGLILLFFAAWILRGAVIRPVVALERAARTVAAGDLGARVEIRGPGELARLADAFDSMTASLARGRESLIRSEKLAGVGRLAAGVAHEVGNPLAAILGYVEMLLGETDARPIDPTLRHDVLARVRAETERIHRIIQELLDYARPPRNEVEAVAVAEVVEAALSLVRAQARLRGAEVKVNLADALPAVRATAGRLTQVLLNLLLNAADANQGEGTITVSARADGEHVAITVADDGPGVPADLAARIFDPFFTTKEIGRGTGLGLSVSQAIIEGYGGSLRLVPSERGASFEISLPKA